MYCLWRGVFCFVAFFLSSLSFSGNLMFPRFVLPVFLYLAFAHLQQHRYVLVLSIIYSIGFGKPQQRKKSNTIFMCVVAEIG